MTNVERVSLRSVCRWVRQVRTAARTRRVRWRLARPNATPPAALAEPLPQKLKSASKAMYPGEFADDGAAAALAALAEGAPAALDGDDAFGTQAVAPEAETVPQALQRLKMPSRRAHRPWQAPQAPRPRRTTRRSGSS